LSGSLKAGNPQMKNLRTEILQMMIRRIEILQMKILMMDLILKRLVTRNYLEISPLSPSLQNKSTASEK